MAGVNAKNTSYEYIEAHLKGMPMRLQVICLFLVVRIAAAVTSQQPRESLNLALVLPVGTRARITVNSEIENVNDGNSHDPAMRTSTIDTDVFLIECVGVEPTGVMRIRQTFQAFKETAKDGEGRVFVEFDTNNTRHPLPQSELFKRYEIGKALTYEVTSDGRASCVGGYDEIADEMAYEAGRELHLGKYGIIQELKRIPLHGVPEFCGMGTLQVGQLESTTESPDSQGEFKEYRKTWVLKSIEEGIAEFEFTVESTREWVGSNDPASVGRQVSGRKHERRRRETSCDVETGLIVQEHEKFEIDDIETYRETEREIIRSHKAIGTVTLTSEMLDPEPRNMRSWLRWTFILVSLGCLLCLGVALRRFRKICIGCNGLHSN